MKDDAGTGNTDERLTREEIYDRLTILDGKSAALLQLSAIILTIGIIPLATGKFVGDALTFCLIIAGIFFVASILLLTVIWVEWEPTIRTLKWRTFAYKWSVRLTGAGLTLITVLIFYLFLMSLYRLKGIF